jgi:hypothetical protein
MRAFVCHQCHEQLVFFENTRCVHCQALLGFDPARGDLLALETQDDGTYRSLEVRGEGAVTGAARYRRCANEVLAACNWLVDADRHRGPSLCASCSLTRIRPNDADLDGLRAFAEAEGAKRQLLFQLADLGLPVTSRHDDPERGLAFDLLTSERDSVVIGHQRGVITLNLAESDDAYRERTRLQLGEAYRTLLGHFRHEIGHYYWEVLVAGGPALEEFRTRFGDERIAYRDAIEQHYEQGPRVGWEHDFVSAYATMHPWEDWAETFAHYLHIRDTLQTAAEFGLMLVGPRDGDGRRLHDLAVTPEGAGYRADRFDLVIDEWLPLTYALNAINRSMGKGDLYPFVLPPAVIGKLAFIHGLVVGSGGSGTA